jgi:hypothetical protein
MEHDIVGALKIKDGLFIGDFHAASDWEFLEGSKVTRIINTCGHEVPNVWRPRVMTYLTYTWTADDSIPLDDKAPTLE